MAITACTSTTEYKLYSGSTSTIHPEFNSVEYVNGELTVVPSVQCRSVRIGGAGINC